MSRSLPAGGGGRGKGRDAGQDRDVGQDRGAGADGGQVALLVLVDALVVTALVLAAAAATQVHLAHQAVRALADAAALDASDSLDTAAYYARGAAPARGVPLTAASVRTSAATYLSDADGGAGRATPQGVRLSDPTGTPDGSTAEVTLTAAVHPWLLPRALGGPVTIQVTVTSRARAGLVAP